MIDVTARALLSIGFDDFTININDRRILRDMLTAMGFAPGSLDGVCVTFDKLDKIGPDGVAAELREKACPEAAVSALADFLQRGEFSLDSVAALCQDKQFATALAAVIKTVEQVAGGSYKIAYSPSLVRGQGYYTGIVFEVSCAAFAGAVAGGGRYDTMIGKFLGQPVPAVGFSIGFERICSILLDQNFAVPDTKQTLALLYDKDADFAAVLAKADTLRRDYAVTVLAQNKKLGKQFAALQQQGFVGAAFAHKDELKLF